MQTLSDQAVEKLKQIAVDKAATINEEHALLLEDSQASKDRAASARDRAMRIGAGLAEVKAAVAHGEFQKWIEMHCQFSAQTARKYMEFSKRNHGFVLPEDLSLRQAMIALDIIPHRPREGAGKSRGQHIPSVYDPLNELTAFLGAVENSGVPQAWETDEMERAAVQAQYRPKLEEFILRLFGIELELVPQI
jgi:hypothetical protein